MHLKYEVSDILNFHQPIIESYYEISAEKFNVQKVLERYISAYGKLIGPLHRQLKGLYYSNESLPNMNFPMFLFSPTNH